MRGRSASFPDEAGAENGGRGLDELGMPAAGRGVTMTRRLEVHSLWTGYGKQAAVQGASLGVEPGEFVAIIGPNGAGKTSLLNVLAGLLPSWRGDVVWGGVNITGENTAARIARGISIVVQGAMAFSTLSIEQNLELALGVRTRPGSANAMATALELFPELVAKRRAAASTLSGGQRQMLALARAVCQQPDLLLLDEPSFGLAVGVRQRVVDMLDTFRRKTGCAVLMAEQDLQMISGADRTYFMSAGRVERLAGSTG